MVLSLFALHRTENTMKNTIVRSTREDRIDKQGSSEELVLVPLIRACTGCTGSQLFSGVSYQVVYPAMSSTLVHVAVPPPAHCTLMKFELTVRSSKARLSQFWNVIAIPITFSLLKTVTPRPEPRKDV
jgi:hypothetical protein